MRIIPLHIFLLSLSVAFVSCHSGKHEHETTSEEADHHEHHDDEIVLEPEDATRFGVETETIESKPFHNSIKATAQILNAPGDQATVVSSTPGIITLNSSAVVGASVQRGQSIGSVNTASVAGGNPNQAAKAALDAAKAELDRLTPLLADGIATLAEYNAAKAAYDAAKASYSPLAASGRIAAPIQGIITQILVKSGDYVDAGTSIATIGKNTELTVLTLVPERYQSEISAITDATLRLPTTGEWVNLSELGGKRISSTQHSFTQSGYIPVSFSVGSSDSFAPGSFVDICLLGSSSENAIAIPTEALTESQGNYFVYVKTGDHTYEKRIVTIGETNGPEAKIISGLVDGEIVVVKGATIVKLAETSGNVPQGHTHNH